MTLRVFICFRNSNPCGMLPMRNVPASYKTSYPVGRYLTPALILYRVIRCKGGGGQIETKNGNFPGQRDRPIQAGGYRKPASASNDKMLWY